MLPILYSFVRCPYAIRARTALVESGVNCILREVDLKNKPISMLNISPKGTVPVLQMPDGSIIEESLDIIYFATQTELPLKDEMAELIKNNDGEFVSLARIYKYPNRYPDESKDDCRKQIEEKFLAKYEKMLERVPYLLGEKSIVDIALFPFIRQFAFVDKEYFFNTKYKNVISWLNKFIENPDFQNITMRKNKPWQEGDEPIYLLEK